jgi:Ice-binding-like/Putative Ig domain
MLLKCVRVLLSVGFAALLCDASAALGQTAPSLGAADSFAVLGGSTVTNTGSSTITGDLGLSPGTAVTGFPPGIVVSGTIHAADAVALAAQNSVTTAYNSLAGQPCTQDLTGQNLGGLTLTAGVYCFASSAQLTGTLTLNGPGVFIFKIGSTLTTASSSSAVVINGGSRCNVFWQVGSSATLGTGTSLAGNILALTSITLTTGASVINGRTLARNGAVTLDTNMVSSCGASTSPPAITFAPSTVPDGAVGVAYSQTFTASGGAPPYRFGVTLGALPPGLTLTQAGVLSGTPTTPGTFKFSVRPTDANGLDFERAFTMSIATGVPTLPQAFVVLLALGLAGVAYFRLRRRERARQPSEAE